jgi:pullulanase/glycogen debranching enzyme
MAFSYPGCRVICTLAWFDWSDKKKSEEFAHAQTILATRQALQAVEGGNYNNNALSQTY